MNVSKLTGECLLSMAKWIACLQMALGGYKYYNNEKFSALNIY